MTFLRCVENKAELFPYLSNVVVEEIQDKVVVSAVNENVVTNEAGLEILPLTPCNMEEANERIFVHVKHASRAYVRIMIKTVGSNIVVIAVANFHQLVPLNELWIEFGAGKLWRFIPIHQAQDDYEASIKKQRLEDERGDSTWILPALSRRLESEEKEARSKKKKKKKEKHKKSKKHKHKKKKQRNDAKSSSEESDEWEEAEKELPSSDLSQTKRSSLDTDSDVEESSATLAVNKTAQEDLKHNIKKGQVEREEWMQSSSLMDFASNMASSRVNKTKQRKDEQRKMDEEERQAIHKSRELNPYWNDGGTGLPENRKIQTKAESTRSVNIGDGGRSWIEKAYERAVQQAKEEGVPLEDIVKKRWGSMDKLNALLKTSRTSRPSENRSSGWRKESTQRSHEANSRRSAAVAMKSNMEQHKTNTGSSSSSAESEDELSPPRQDRAKESATTTREDKLALMKQETTRPLSEKEKNELGAKMLRAELIGDEELAKNLQSQLESGVVRTSNSTVESRINNDSHSVRHNSSDEEATEILTRQDKHGNLYPVKLKSHVGELNQKRKIKKKIMKTHDVDGQRVRYFEDDDKVSLKAMVEQERLTSASDHLAMTSRLAAKHMGSTQGDDFTLDDMFITASATKGTMRNEEKRIKDKAVAEHKLREKQLGTCRFCFENPRIAKHLIISIGKKSYLAVPINASLTDGHCLIVPMSHVIGQTFFDEDVMEEVKLFKRNLVQMFSDEGEDMIFLETCKNLRHQNHCIIECVPVPKEIGDMAPIYFKKALMECESEWSQNRKVVDISAKTGITTAVPKGLPYFAVEFGLDGGFAHVIEEEQNFQHYFGKEIIGGIMDLEPRMWRKPPKESFEQHKKKVLRFAERWKPYDWTQKI